MLRAVAFEIVFHLEVGEDDVDVVANADAPLIVMSRPRPSTVLFEVASIRPPASVIVPSTLSRSNRARCSHSASRSVPGPLSASEVTR